MYIIPQVFPVVRCKVCGEQWRYTWASVFEYIPQPLRDRLQVYANNAEPMPATA